MAAIEVADTAGGFVRTGLASSPPTSAAATSTATGALPKPRSKPLKLGSSKEGAFIDYVDTHITLITRRYASKTGPEGVEKKLGLGFVQGAAGQDGEDADALEDENIKGYESFKEAGADIEKLLDVVWVSGTPSLQISYLLTLALLVVTYITSFPAAPKTTFRVLSKLDLAFSQLLQGKDLDSGETLPGFESGPVVSGTQKVRIRSLAERTRVVVVEVMDSSEFEIEDADDEDGNEHQNDPVSKDLDVDVDMGGADSANYDMEVAKVYDRTLQELGDSLDARVEEASQE